MTSTPTFIFAPGTRVLVQTDAGPQRGTVFACGFLRDGNGAIPTITVRFGSKLVTYRGEGECYRVEAL